MTVNGDLLNAAIRHQIGLNRLTVGTIRKIIRLLNDSEASLVAALRKFDPLDEDIFSQRRLERQLVAVRDVLKEAYAAVNNGLKSEVYGLAEYESEYQVKMISATLPISLDIVTPSAVQLYAAVEARPFQGRLLKEWGSEIEEGAFKRIRDTLRQGYAEGQTTDQIIRAIVGTRSANYEDGIANVSRQSVSMMVRTALNHTANVARQKTYEDNSDVISGWRFVATLDGRTSITCMSLDGTTHPPGEGPFPPRHPNCRSTTVPVIKSWRELGFDVDDLPPAARASMDGVVPGKESYNDWLGKQDEAFQDDVLGTTRGALFRDGGLTLDKFTDREGVEYTLAELRQREAEAFERAGL